MPTCFVVMGFGEKAAFYGGKKKQRTINLDKSFENIIFPAVTAAGHDCIRADNILHSTAIDKPMYEQLLSADVVVADLSTSNPNALYELGVRHGLRPWTTIVIAEKEFAFPFDVARLNIMRYEHLGPDIGATEAARATEELRKRIVAIAPRREVDSPVFLFLPNLRTGGGAVGKSLTEGRDTLSAEHRGPSIADLRASVAEAKMKVLVPIDWQLVAERLEALRALQPEDPYTIQQLALATYKSETPDKVVALENACTILEELEPRVSSDGETVGIWGAIHKRLWEANASSADLDEAIRAHERGFRIRNDHYNGINFALLLDIRASLAGSDDATADRVWAMRVRREVVAIADGFMADETRREDAEAVDVPAWNELRYWVRASRAEALFGLGRRAEAATAFEEAKSIQPPPQVWMVNSTVQQLRKLAELLKMPPL